MFSLLVHEPHHEVPVRPTKAEHLELNGIHGPKLACSAIHHRLVIEKAVDGNGIDTTAVSILWMASDMATMHSDLV